MGVVSSWEELQSLPVGVYQDALMVLGAEGEAMKNQREKAALKSDAPRKRRR